jgi:hypothetical protein
MIVLVVLSIFVLGFFLYYAILPAISIGILDSPQTAWKDAKADALRDIPISFGRGDMMGGMFLYRQVKCNAEYYGVSKSKFIEFVAKLKESIPSSTDTVILPHDLRNGSSQIIQFGLCSKGNNRLKGQVRLEEMNLFAQEVVSASESGNIFAIEGYHNLLQNLYFNGFLDQEDKKYLEQRVGIGS